MTSMEQLSYGSSLTRCTRKQRKMLIKFCLVFLVVALSAVVSAQPVPQHSSGPEPKVIREKNNNDGSGNYLFTYELDNNQIFSEAGALKTVGDTQFVVVSGQYSYVGPDGITYWVTYTADENGFHPIIGTGSGGIAPGGDAEIDPNALKSLIG